MCIFVAQLACLDVCNGIWTNQAKSFGIHVDICLKSLNDLQLIERLLGASLVKM